MKLYILFFFSSRRRHTRLQGDWSSDVCSSDLESVEAVGPVELGPGAQIIVGAERGLEDLRPRGGSAELGDAVLKEGRSEERRVGKEGWSGRVGEGYKKIVIFVYTCSW